MKRGEIFVLSILKFLSLAVSLLAAQLLTKLVIRFTILFVELDFTSASIIRMISLLAITFGLWFFLGFKEGYRNGFFDIRETLPAAGIATAFHVLLGIPFRFNPWVSGATRHVAGFLSLGSAYNSEERIAEIPLWAGILTAMGLAIALCALCLLAEKIGARKRLRDREALTENK